VGVLVSTVQNPNNFDNFTDDGKPQFAFPYQKEDIEGYFCVHIDLAQANVTGGLQSGQNVSLEIVFDGPDGELYQVCTCSFGQITFDIYEIPSVRT
jgi:hypothetical protein